MTEAWPAGRHPLEDSHISRNGHVEGRDPPGTWPIPAGRGRWRLTLHRRQYASTVRYTDTLITELADARGRQLVRAWNTPASLTFTIDGHAASAGLIAELATDVIAWRFDDQSNSDIPIFRGVVDHAVDTVTEEAHTVTFTAHDYLAMLTRRILTSTYTVTATDQDVIASDLVTRATGTSSSSGVSFNPGSYLPLYVTWNAPDGSVIPQRPLSGQLRDRTYPPSTNIGTALDELAKVIGGFDYDCRALGQYQQADDVRVYYPYQGVNRTDMALVYGSSVSSLARTVDSASYANYQRVLGNNGSSDPAAPQLYAEAWNSDTNNVTINPVGLWQNADNAADVTIQSTLGDKAGGDLALSGVLVPTYTLSLRPGAYYWGAPNMGDVVPLIVKTGRLNVNTTVRVLGITFTIGDDGQEDVTLTVGRPAVTLPQLLAAPMADIDALTRR